eukprot:3143894-Pyramimonas_sp.AAC.1
MANPSKLTGALDERNVISSAEMNSARFGPTVDNRATSHAYHKDRLIHRQPRKTVTQSRITSQSVHSFQPRTLHPQTKN